MTIIAGYLINTKHGIEGEPGLGYNYIMAHNGVFIQADGQLLAARIPMVDCNIRGLASLDSYVTLKHGKIPQSLFDLALNKAIAEKEKEIYFAITWKDGYHLFLTPQERQPDHVKYDALPDTLLDIHSHGATLGAFFSGEDNADDQGFRISCVLGKLSGLPVIKIRIGVYGYFCDLKWADIFEGTLTSATEHEAEEGNIDELQSEIPVPDQSSQDRYRWHWWNGLFTRRWTH